MRTDDGSIIYECLNGEPEAFGVLVDKYKEGIYAYVYHKLGDFHDAQDVTQEVFLQAYRGLRSLRRWESFGFWLYRIAYARCSQWLRTKSKRVDKDFIQDQDSRIMDAGSLDSHRDDQLNQSLREALDSLPEIHREVLTLYYFGGMKSKEIARAIGASPGAIRVRLSRARAQLKEEMVNMMDTAFEGQKIPAGFTLRIVETVRRIKPNPTPRTSGLPLGLSLAMGIIITVLSLSPHISTPSDMSLPSGSPLPVEAKALKAGEIPVEILKTPNISAIASRLRDGDAVAYQNAVMLAPQQDEGVWVRKEDMGTSRCFSSSATVDGKLFVFGGSKDLNLGTLTVLEYDPESETWTKLADMPEPRVSPASVKVKGKILVFGGEEGWKTGALDSVLEFAPRTQEWKEKTEMPISRRWHTATELNGEIYLIGGETEDKTKTPIVDVYNPDTDTWRQAADFPVLMVFMSSCALNDKLYVLGGSIDGDPGFTGEESPRLYEYDPTLDKWTRLADMSTARNGHATFIMDGLIVAVGGDNVHINGDLMLDTTEFYDPDTNTWTKGPDFPEGIAYFSIEKINGKAYAVGGMGVWPTSEKWIFEFTPEGWVPHSVSPEGKLPTKWGEIKSDQ